MKHLVQPSFPWPRRGGCGAALPQIWLGSILGYFAGGLLVGPSVFGIFTEPSTIPHLAELAILICPISN